MSSSVITRRNRANAAHSTGPITPEGKARSSQNSLKLGLSIQRHVILPHEGPAEFEALHADLLRAYGPQSERESLAVQEIAHCQWAFRRFDAAELNALSTPPLDTDTGERYEGVLPLDFISVIPTNRGDARYEWTLLHNLTRYRAHWERRHQRAIADFDRACMARHREARERRAHERHQIAQHRHQMLRERQDSKQPRAPQPSEAPSHAPCQPESTANLYKTNAQPPTGFVPHSGPASSIPAGPIAHPASPQLP